MRERKEGRRGEGEYKKEGGRWKECELCVYVMTGRAGGQNSRRGRTFLSMRRRYDTHAGVLAPILRCRTIIPLSERRRKCGRAIRRLARWRGQRVPRRRRGCAFRRAYTRYVRQIRITPDPAREIVHRPLHRLRERPWLLMMLRRWWSQ